MLGESREKYNPYEEFCFSGCFLASFPPLPPSRLLEKTSVFADAGRLELRNERRLRRGQHHLNPFPVMAQDPPPSTGFSMGGVLGGGHSTESGLL